MKTLRAFALAAVFVMSFATNALAIRDKSVTVDRGDLKVGTRADNWERFWVEAVKGTIVQTIDPLSTTRYPWDVTINVTRAAGASGLSLDVTQTTNALSSGSMQALDVTANAGSTTNVGTIRGAQIKARQPDAGTGGLTAIYASVDIKDQATTDARGLEVSIDGDSGGTATNTQGVTVLFNGSGNQGTSYAYDVNNGTASGHGAFTADFRGQNGETISNGTDGYWILTATRVQASGIIESVGNALLASVDVGGGYGASGSTLTATGTAQFDGTVTVGKAAAVGGSVVILAATSGGITLTPITAGTGATTIVNQAGTPTITLPATTCTLPGLGLANAFTAANTFTATGITDAALTMVYGNVNQTTTALTNDLIGVRGNARVDVDSTSGKAIGGYFLAGNTTNGFNMEEVRGIYCGTVTKTPTAADKTWTNVKGIEIVTGNTATGATYKTDVTNLYGVRLRIGSSTGSGGNVCGDITNGYGVWVDHEQQGLACRTLDAGFYLSATNISGGNAAWAYGLDMSAVGANMGTADIRLSQGETIDNLANGTIAFGGKLGVTDVITQTVTSSGTSAEYNGIVQTVTVGTNNTGSIVGTSFSTNGAANKTSGNIIGLWASADQVSATSVVSGLITGAYFDLNLGAATGLPTGTGYGVVIENSDWSNDRAYRPKAFVAFLEGDNGATLSTTALFDIGAQGKPVTSAADCTQILNTDSPGAVDCGLRILINNEVYYILMVKGGS